MRYRLMATYRGIPYEASVGPTSSDIVLFAASPPADELGFESAVGHWRKRVSRDDTDALWEMRPVGQYRSQPCLVLDEIGDRLHITYLGHDAYLAERLGYWQVDRGVYEVVVPRDEVAGLTEQRAEHSVRPGHAGIPAEGAAAGGPGEVPQPAPAPQASRTAVTSPAGWDDHEGWNTGPRVPDRTPSANGANAQDRAGSLNGATSASVADLHDPAAPVSMPSPPQDELSETPWTEMLDTLPPPRPLPKRRRPEKDRPATAEPAAAEPAAAEKASPPAGGRRRRTPVETRWIFRDLVDMAAISHGSYAVDEEIDGALCLIKTDDGYEVFSAIDGAKHEVRFFEDEEAAYFYLFGVLAAEAVRNGQLVPKTD